MLHLLCPPEPEKIIHTMDVAFLVDSSDGVTPINFEREKNFLKTIVRSLNLSPGLSRVSIIPYSERADVTVNFSDRLSMDSLLRRIDNIPYYGGRKQIDQALQLAASRLFLPGGSARQYVPRTLVIVTDGEQERLTAGTAFNESLALLKENGVKFLVVAIGGDVDGRELDAFVEDENDVFIADSFETLAAQAAKVTESASKFAGMFSFFFFKGH